MSKLFEQLLEQRGFNRDFLLPDYDKKASPSLLPDLEKAIARIKKALKNKEKILIFGDYDVDGVTASTLMFDALSLAGFKDIAIMLPDRFKDGYGMSRRVIDCAKKQNRTLVITVDCGSRNNEIIKELKALKIDTIVTDHHECGPTPPEAVAFLNPKRNKKGKDNPFYEFAGVGIAFILACGLVEAGLIPKGQEKWLLDLVLIGSICDNMKMLGENRRLCFWGLKVLEKTRRVGLRELKKLIKIQNIDSTAIGFQIGPRLNAAGRLETAEISLNLLMSKTAPEAAQLAQKLEELNQIRKTKQRAALQEINSKGLPKDPVIVVSGDWHEGILGIIAGRLVEEYQRPAFALTAKGDELKGSGRSFGDFSLANALMACEKAIIGGGGHAGACGVRLKKASLPAFVETLNTYYNSLKLVDQIRFLNQVPDLHISDLSELSLEFLEELGSLEPFGIGNLEPTFLLEKVFITDVYRMGSDQNHLRLSVRDHSGHSLKLLAFFAPEPWLKLSGGETANILINLTENNWQGLRSPEGRILKIRVVD